MQKLINISPSTIEFIEKVARERFGGSQHKFSAALEWVIDEVRRKREMEDLIKENKKLKRTNSWN